MSHSKGLIFINLNKKKYRFESILSICLSIPLFILNPILGIVFSLMINCFNSKFDNLSLDIFLLMLSIFLGLLNTTKIVEGDLITYFNWFNRAKELNFIHYIFIHNREPVFFGLNYLINYICSNDFEKYLIIITALPYFLVFIALKKFYLSQFEKTSKWNLIFVIIYFAFFPQVFSISAHLIRQFVASGFLMLAIVNRLYYKKSSWLLFFCAGFTHSTTLFFVLVILLLGENIDNVFTLKKISLLFIGTLLATQILILTSGIIANFITIDWVRYVFVRATLQGDRDFQVINFLSFLMMFTLLCFSFSIYWNFEHKNQIKIINIFYALLFFIIVTLWHNELSGRFSYYIYFFSPFIILLFTQKIKLERYLFKIFSAILLVMLIFYFIYKIKYGAWTYESVDKVLFSTLTSLLI